MKRKDNFSISIAKPCSQDWSVMTEAQNGKHCQQCDKIVLDFSAMTDNELLHFFKENGRNNCGRFHSEQLERKIIPLKKDHFFKHYFQKIAASIFTILSLKTIPGLAAKKTIEIVHNGNHNKYLKDSVPTSKTIVSGTVKDRKNNPIENATVTFCKGATVKTDKDGNFSYELSGDTLTEQNIYFSYDRMVTKVRSYNPSMQNATFNVSLYKSEPLGRRLFVMGMPAFRPIFEGEYPGLAFKKNSTNLHLSNKDLLRAVAFKLKDNPDARIIITGYPDQTLRSQNICSKRLENIKTYLNYTLGIDAGRISLDCNVDGGKTNIIDIKEDLL